MGQVFRTDASHQDYREIWHYIAVDSIDAANGVVRAFDDALAMLAQYPNAGRRRPSLGKNLRSFPVGEYLLFYRPINDDIELLRVMHGARKFKRKHFEQ